MPADYVNKLARMFQDIKVSEDLNQQFKETYKNSKGNLAGNLYIKCIIYITNIFSRTNNTNSLFQFYIFKFVVNDFIETN